MQCSVMIAAAMDFPVEYGVILVPRPGGCLPVTQEEESVSGMVAIIPFPQIMRRFIVPMSVLRLMPSPRARTTFPLQRTQSWVRLFFASSFTRAIILGMKNIKFLVATLGLSAGLVLGTLNAQAQTAPACDFIRDLEVGMMGSDVLCLQKFLNGAGFTISSSGVGSPGSETDLFGSLTEEAVIRWQASQGIMPASGYFGPKSRTAYKAGGAMAPVITPGTPVDPAAPSFTASAAQEIANKINEYLETIKRLEAENAALKNGTKEESKEEAAVRKLLQEAHDLVEDADDSIDDADDEDAQTLNEADDDLTDAAEDLFDGMLAFIDKDLVKSRSHAEDAVETAEDIISDLGGDENDADDALSDAEEAVDDAKDEIRDAEDDDKDVDEAEDLLNDAENKLEDAEDAFDDGDFDDAIELAEEAEELANEAVDAIGN